MKEWRKGVAWTACHLWRGVRAALPEPPALRVLMYHSVGTPVPGDRRALYDLGRAQFRSHMTTVASASRCVRPLCDAAEDADGLAITFDDGFRNILRVAAPILVERRLPFTVFATSAFIRSHDPTYLAPDDLRELANLPGVTVGAHGSTHVPLTDCDDRTLRRELSESRDYLEDLLQRPITMMSYPYGAVDARVRAAVAEAGYTLAACSRFGANRSNHDRLRLKRIDIWSTDGQPEFVAKLRGDWDWLGWIRR